MKNELLVILFFVIFQNISAYSQPSIGENTNKQLSEVKDAESIVTNLDSTRNLRIENNKKIFRYSILTGVPILTILYGIKAWDWAENDNYRWGKENWFGQNTDSGGADKVGHCYSHYIVMRISYSIFNYTEDKGAMKWIYSISLAAGVGALIEFGDAFTGRYGFSYEDLIADYVGIGIGALLEKYPTLDRFIGFSGEYIPTKGFKEYPNKTFLNFPGDYSGWKWMLNFKLAGFSYIGLKTPDFFRYLMVNVGYYTRGYTSYDKYIGDSDKRRYWYFGISVNLMEIVTDLYSDKNSMLCRFSRQPFKYYHIPIGYEKSYCLD